MITMKLYTTTLLFFMACLLAGIYGRSSGGGGHRGGHGGGHGGGHDGGHDGGRDGGHDGGHDGRDCPDGSHPPKEGDEKTSFDSAAEEAKAYRQKARDKEREIASQNKNLDGKSASGKHSSLGRVRSSLLRKGQKSAGVGKAASKMKEDNHDPGKIYFGGTSYGEEVCIEKPDCTGLENEPYRTMDGSCNNLANGWWGMAGTAFLRLLSPAYGDKHQKYRPRSHAENGKKLASPRVISRLAFDTGEVLDSKLSLMAMQYGQYLDHDITHTPVNTILNDDGSESGISCCENGYPIPKEDAHEECYPIDIENSPTNPDPLYSVFGTCVNFVRSLPVADNDCLLTARQQMNAITAFVDASNIYGSSDEEANILRTGSEGLLRTQDGDLLPAAPASEECGIVDGKSCFLAGDVRANEQVGLTVKHTLWMREHNRIAKYLKETGGMTDDEQIFQLARRIVVAEWQHITYNEYLTAILGETSMAENELLPDENIPYFNNYDDSLDPSIFNSFATSAYRFGHTMIKGVLQLYQENGSYDSVDLKDVFFAPHDLYDSDYTDGLCRGLSRSNAHKVDNILTDQVREHLFEEEGHTAGLDLMALNIQRGRDHGLQPYNKYREFCGMTKLQSFEDLKSNQFYPTPANVDLLKDAYQGSVNELDLFVGGLLEKPEGDAQVGPTFKCLIGEQFNNLKKGDRFFYDNYDQPQRFTEAQLQDIKRNVTLAGIMCENAPNLQKLQRNMFLQADSSPELVDCSSIPRINLGLYVNP